MKTQPIYMFNRVCSSARFLALAFCFLPYHANALDLTRGFERLAHNTRFSLDAATAFYVGQNQTGSVQTLGLDVHRVFSGDKGDIATLTLQPYFLRTDVPVELDSYGRRFSTKSSVMQWRVSNVNFKMAPRGLLSLRAGHFELPFGAEQIVQTNGTLQQLNVEGNTGLKADWGISLNGSSDQLEYEFGWLRGGGNRIGSSADGYFVGRVGRLRDNDWWFGLSALQGSMEYRYGGHRSVLERSRWGLDFGFRHLSGFRFLADLSTGRDDAQRGTHALLELGHSNSRETLTTYLQWRNSRYRDSTHAGNSGSATVGARYEPGLRWSLSLEYRQRLRGQKENNHLAAQFRWRT